MIRDRSGYATGDAFIFLAVDKCRGEGVSVLAVVRELIHQDVSPKCVNEENSTERRSYNRQVNRSPQLQCEDLSQY